MGQRTPRPDILSVPLNNNYYDGLKEAETKVLFTVYIIIEFSSLIIADEVTVLINPSLFIQSEDCLQCTGFHLYVIDGPFVRKKFFHCSFFILKIIVNQSLLDKHVYLTLYSPSRVTFFL